MKLLNIVFMLLLFGSVVSAQAGYKIVAEVANFSEKEAYLAYYYGEKPYIRDTIEVKEGGPVVFEGEEALPGGIYLIVLPPDNKFVQVFISEGEQHFTLEVDANDLANSVVVKGSEDNKLFYDYMAFLGNQIKKKEELMTQKEAASEKEVAKIETQLEALDEEVKTYHSNIRTNHPKTLTAAFISNRTDPEMPEFEGTDEEVQKKRWLYVRDHFFDLIDMTDERLVRTAFLYHRIDQYINKLTVQHPDSISVAIDEVLRLVKPAEETFKFYLVHFLNTYAKSKIVGMDAVYVHLVEKYYATGLAPWTEEDQLNKIIKNATTLKPILIGKTAPDIRVQKQDKTPISLHEVKADFTVLFFWDPECGHCKKSMGEMVAFYDQFKDKGVEVFAVCTRVTDDIPKCWEFIEEKDMVRWINVVDPYLKSRYKQLYDIRTTPQIFILDDKKEILSKRIGVEQLPEVLENLMKLKKETKKVTKEG